MKVIEIPYYQCEACLSIFNGVTYTSEEGTRMVRFNHLSDLTPECPVAEFEVELAEYARELNGRRRPE